uniref:Uncharacterized protein n=1 Tax=Timema tahoe TaxID=61484 RepID=A0A7R9NWL8_9NEOP|nr:unnamed protein product [Timema tahoe]
MLEGEDTPFSTHTLEVGSAYSCSGDSWSGYLLEVLNPGQLGQQQKRNGHLKGLFSNKTPYQTTGSGKKKRPFRCWFLSARSDYFHPREKNGVSPQLAPPDMKTPAARKSTVRRPPATPPVSQKPTPLRAPGVQTMFRFGAVDKMMFG